MHSSDIIIYGTCRKSHRIYVGASCSSTARNDDGHVRKLTSAFVRSACLRRRGYDDADGTNICCVAQSCGLIRGIVHSLTFSIRAFTATCIVCRFCVAVLVTLKRNKVRSKRIINWINKSLMKLVTTFSEFFLIYNKVTTFVFSPFLTARARQVELVKQSRSSTEMYWCKV